MIINKVLLLLLLLIILSDLFIYLGLLILCFVIKVANENVL